MIWGCGKWVFRDGFAEAGWCWGFPRHHLLFLGLAQGGNPGVGVLLVLGVSPLPGTIAGG
ncbi:MAG: hypothetical protein DA408_17905 [Bacteroidetes bacterium]|nr:MAG: hypothetical protein C7N36_12605 [Bacteroidota bacterium]PTM09628.1 MAG: hypothetical protein DA408_17905 [Bacteroidota bacterium]